MGIILEGIISAVLLYFLYHSQLPNAKMFFWSFVVIICIAIPQLGVFLLGVGIVYFFISNIKEANNGK